MAHTALASLVRYLRHLHNPTDEPSDRELLGRYTANRDEAAFAALVHRHASLVWSVCRRLLDNEQDAEDAFQAVFLVLLRKSASLRVGPSLAGWLHAVAVRITQKSRVAILRRRLRERRVEIPTPSDPFAAVEGRDLRIVLDEELDRLPEKYRAPLVLCYLEGLSYAETARRLGWRDGTVCGRLARARELLRQRLSRRGLTLSGAALVTAISESSSAPAMTMAAAARMATWFALGEATSGSVSPPVASLAHSVLQAMNLAKLKSMAVLFAVVCVFSGGGGLAAYRLWTVNQAPPEQIDTPPPAADNREPPRKKSLVRTDRYGDPLPAGAIARIGTMRFREGKVIFALAYSPDGRMLASGTGEYPHNNRVRLWDAATGKQLRVLQPELNQIKSLAFSPNGKLLASISELRGQASGGVHVWNTTTGQEIRALRHPEMEGWVVAFSGDSRRLAGGGWHEVCFWDTKSGKETHRIQASKRNIFSFALSPDGKTFASANDDYTIGLWDARSAKELRRLTLPKIAAKYLSPFVTFSPDSKVVAGGANGSVYLWDAATGGQRLAIPGHDKWKNPRGFSQEGPAVVAFSPDGKYLAAGNEGIVYDAATGKERCHLQNYHRWIRSLVYSPDGKTLAGESSYRIRFWDAATGKEIFRDTSHEDAVASVVFSADGRTVFTASRDDSIGVWETATGREHFRFEAPRRSTFDWHHNEIAVAPDAKTAAAWLEGSLYTWDVRKPKPLRKYADDIAGFDSRSGIAFSPQGRLLAALWKYKDKRIRLWTESTAKAPRLLKVHESGNNGLLFSPDGKTLASAGPNGTAGLWDVATGQELRTVPGFNRMNPKNAGQVNAAVFSMAFSPDSKILALGSEDGSIGLWDKDGGREIRRLVSSYHRGWVGTIAFSPDGKTVAAGYQDGAVRFWETITGQIRREWATQSGSILALNFSPDGRLLASAGSDTTVLIWTTEEVAELRDLSARELKTLWNDLASDDAAKAYRAMGILRAAARQTLPFLKTHLRPVAGIEAKHIAKLIADLDDADFAVRDRASAELAKHGELAEPALRKTLTAQPSLEVRRRIEAILDGLNRPPSAETLRQLRGVEILEWIASPEAGAVLESLAQGASGARQTREAKAALMRWTNRQAPR